ncbi:glycosyltransferase [Microlunatus parietis]|uniref:GT2 family glycosyltransferase n=1 Tax=Microlunatus parietis TaxID=682979 RepID=A0A7Y9I248_9ACTN|nr:glycosyltransferase [Microlunatus parietis]NYE68853.1 GT2 family glycosyltransferase [Microlunatus parietis]
MTSTPSDAARTPAGGVALSLLTCSTNTRYRTFGRAIQDQIWPQYDALPEADRARVEIMILTDNKAMMLGEKRNVMVDAARGEYVQFIDDDDRIEPDLITSVLAAIDANPGVDVITFLASVTINGGPPKICRYSKAFGRDLNTPTEYRRLPNHICCIRREVALQATFPNLIRGEDSAYSRLLLPHLRTEHAIDRVLYHYDYSDETTETQQHRRGVIRTRPDQPPIVDVVVLSNATGARLRRMTQHTIDTCLAGANTLPVRVIVLEQQQVRYQRAETVHAPEPFGFNEFANRGARLGSAEWIMIANNDLVFEDGWLHQLLAAGHPIVSPLNPGDHRQRDLDGNETGRVNGRHLSGWCYMITRKLWQQIGGFDERLRFWCCDDAVLEQCVAAGVDPMIVPAARVRHLVSATLRSSASSTDRDALTWGQVDLFNRLYGRDKFTDDPRYAAWRARNAAVPA